MSTENKNFYNSDSMPYLEQAILAKNVSFRDPTERVEGDFFIKVLTPSVDTTSVYEDKKKDIQSANYITIPIPNHLLYQFMTTDVKSDTLCFRNKTNVIPAGTKFYLEFLGGDPLIEKMIIVGVEPPSGGK